MDRDERRSAPRTRSPSILSFPQDVLQVMVVIAVIVNSALIGMGDLVHRIVPGLSDTLTVILIVVVEVSECVSSSTYSCLCVYYSETVDC